MNQHAGSTMTDGDASAGSGWPGADRRKLSTDPEVAGERSNPQTGGVIHRTSLFHVKQSIRTAR